MSWTRVARATAVGLIAAAVYIPSARARPRSFSLNWVRDANAKSCMTSAELARSVERALGPVFVTPADAEFAIEGRIQRDEAPSGWSAQIAVSDARGAALGSRLVRSTQADCRALNVQVALVVIMIIDPEIALDGLPPELFDVAPGSADPAADLLAELKREQTAGEVTATAAATPAASSQTERPPGPPARRPPAAWRAGFSLETGLALGSGQLAQPAVGPWLGARLEAARWLSFALRTLLWLPNDAPLPAPTNGTASVTLMMSATTLEACAMPLRGRQLTLDTCAGLLFGLRWLADSELKEPESSVHAAIGPSLSAQLGFRPAQQLAIIVGAAVDLPLNPPSFVYHDASGRELELFSPGTVAVTAWLGGAYRFF